MHKELDMVHGQGSDKLGAGVLPDMLKVMGMKPNRQRMATVVALKEHNDPPSCSAGRHKKADEAMTHQHER
jgi:hypothetical protein